MDVEVGDAVLAVPDVPWDGTIKVISLAFDLNRLLQPTKSGIFSVKSLDLVEKICRFGARQMFDEMTK
ncbi:hypothetical protein EV1_038561 [Malus domestica]